VNNLGYIIKVNSQYLSRYFKSYNEEPECSHCGMSLVKEKEAFKSKKHIYCIPCQEQMYFDSTIDITDEELENFFKIV